VPGRNDLLDVQLGPAQLLLSAVEQFSCAMQVTLALTLTADINALEDLRLQGRT
jgi:hypothetical protein